MSWIELLDLAQDGHAVGIRQPVVEQHEVDALLELLERRLAGAGLEDLVAVGLEPLAQRPADQSFVVDDQNGGFWHRFRPG